MSPPAAVDLAGVTTAARQASRAWRHVGTQRRLEVLQEVGRHLAQRRDALVQLIRRDGPSRAIAEYFADWIVHAADPELLARYARDSWRRVDTEGGPELLVRRPDGVVLLSPPQNSSTIQTASIFSMLLVGNAVIVRAPPGQERGVQFMVDDLVRPALARAGLPLEVATVIVMRAQAALGALIPSPDVDTIVFFGNDRVGREVAAQALRHRKKAVLELEGSDHLVVWKDADLVAAVESASRAWMGSTQACALPKHVLVHGAMFDRFLGAFLEAVPRHASTVLADPENGMLAPLWHPERFVAALEQVRELGEVHCGGHLMGADGGPNAVGPFAAATVVSLDSGAVRLQSLLCFDEEICFPLIPIVRFDGDDDRIAEEMIEVLLASPFGLRLSLWVRDPSVLARFVREVGSVGLLLCNDDHVRTPRYASPWGGPKRSGGPRGESHFFWEQTSHLQAIVGSRLDPAQLESLLAALGCVR